MDAGIIPCSSHASFLYLKSAILAMEPVQFLITLARQAGGESITSRVQTFILEECIDDIVAKSTELNHKYAKSIVQKLIAAIESTSETVVEGLYEKFAYYLTIPWDQFLKENNRIYKKVTFLLSQVQKCPGALDLVVSLQCSLNLLEGDTGCALWPSSLYLSELILSYQDMFSNKFCFEIGSGVGLVGITLCHVGAFKVILSDGDTSTLANMKNNIELNHLDSETKTASTERTDVKPMVECRYLQWESASRNELQAYQPDIILGADIIYDPLCIPHLVEVFSALLQPTATSDQVNRSGLTKDADDFKSKKAKEPPIGYIATVIRNQDTFDCFLRLAAESSLSVLDITQEMKPLNLLPYMLSYERSSVHLLRVSHRCN